MLSRKPLSLSHSANCSLEAFNKMLFVSLDCSQSEWIIVSCKEFCLIHQFPVQTLYSVSFSAACLTSPTSPVLCPDFLPSHSLPLDPGLLALHSAPFHSLSPGLLPDFFSLTLIHFECHLMLSHLNVSPHPQEHVMMSAAQLNVCEDTWDQEWITTGPFYCLNS